MSEATIILRCADGDEDACRHLYQSYMPYLLTIVRRYGIKERNERDVLQNIFIEIFSNLSHYSADKGSFKTWARTVAVYNILNYKRQSRRLQITHLEESQDYTSAIYLDLSDLDTAYIIDAIRELPEHYQNVFNLFAIDGYSHKEIGDLLGITSTASRSLLHRAKAALQKSITQLNVVG